MSIGVLLICVELIMMLVILLFVPREAAGASFLGFAIGESLGASALRIAGGIFTKIADIGSDLMKVVFKIKEDDPRNPGVIADCTGDNAGDSVGPTADGFETYGVTGVALISFIALAVIPELQGPLPGVDLRHARPDDRHLDRGLQRERRRSPARRTWARTRSTSRPRSRAWCGSPRCSRSWSPSWSRAGCWPAWAPGMWWKLSTIISCGTLAAALIPELTKVFTSSNSGHTREIVAATREGGASLTILSGLVAGNFSVFWKASTLAALLFVAYLMSQLGLDQFMSYPSVFAFGLVAFGLLGMGPVTIAVDSYGPVTDNAQSIFELSQIETTPGSAAEIEKQFGFKPDFAHGKHMLEDNDGAGNTFKATAKPVLIATAVAGATTMIFSVIVLLKKHAEATGGAFDLSLTEPRVLLGFIMGGATIYWFTGASMQAVTTGAYRAVEFIKRNIHLESAEKASVKDSKEVVKICTQYAQAGMFNIFIVIFCLTLAYAFFNPIFFVAYLDLDRGRRPVPGRLHGERRRGLGQRQEGGRGGPARRRAPTCTPPRSSATRWAIPTRTPRRWP